MDITLVGSKGLLLKGKNCLVALEPTDENAQVLPGAAKADVVLVSEALKQINGEKMNTEDVKIFTWPGEYEVKGTSIQAIPLNSDVKDIENKLIFVINMDTFRICYIPDLKKELHSDLIERIGDVDILVFPIGFDQKIITSTLEEVEPKAVLPLQRNENIGGFEDLVKSLGSPMVEDKEKISITSKANFSNERMEILALK